MEYTDINAATVDKWVANGWEWGKPISHETFVAAKNGGWRQFLTPTKDVPHEWMGDVRGKRILGLACGGAQQMPVFAALGAVCTVLDYSLAQLESERVFAEREGYEIAIVRADMSKPLPFADGEFDMIFHPVSNCYIREVEPVWRECFRVLKKGGRLLAGMDNGINFIIDEQDESRIAYSLPFDPLSDPELYRKGIENGDGVQFSHTLEEQLGGQLRAGFRLLDLYEDTNGAGFLHEHGIPTFWASCAEKT